MVKFGGNGKFKQVGVVKSINTKSPMNNKFLLEIENKNF